MLKSWQQNWQLGPRGELKIEIGSNQVAEYQYLREVGLLIEKYTILAHHDSLSVIVNNTGNPNYILIPYDFGGPDLGLYDD